MFHRLTVAALCGFLACAGAASASELYKSKAGRDCDESALHRPDPGIEAQDLNAEQQILPKDFGEKVNVDLHLPLEKYVQKPDAYNAPLERMEIDAGTLSIGTKQNPCAEKPVK